MAEILLGKPVVDALKKRTEELVGLCTERGVEPTLAILRVGEREDDLSYERGAVKRCEAAGVSVKKTVLSSDVPEKDFFEALRRLNQDEKVHGILMFQPLPKGIDSVRARNELSCEKDVDGCTDGSLAGVFTNSGNGFTPCTAQAAIEILKYYNIPICGKKAVVIGRSLVVGRPVAMLLMHENATVTICHTRTVNIQDIVRTADIVIASSGQMESIGKEYLRSEQTLIDVGIGWNEAKQKLCGDVRFEEAEGIVSALTPVPGGVGSVTSSILVLHTAEAAYKSVFG